MSKSLLMLLCAVLVFGVSCKKDDPDPNNNNSAPMSAKIDGSAWSATTANATYDQNVLSVAGSTNTMSSMSFSIEDITAPGTFTIDGSSGAYAMYAASQTDSYSTMIGGTGTIIVTEFTSNSAKGTFTFTAKNNSGAQKSVTDGKFSVTF